MTPGHVPLGDLTLRHPRATAIAGVVLVVLAAGLLGLMVSAVVLEILEVLGK